MNFCTSVQDVCDEGLILSVHEVPIGPVWKPSNSLKMSRGVHRVELSLLLFNVYDKILCHHGLQKVTIKLLVSFGSNFALQVVIPGW
jgi:hypothetical protein